LSSSLKRKSYLRRQRHEKKYIKKPKGEGSLGGNPPCSLFIPKKYTRGEEKGNKEEKKRKL